MKNYSCRADAYLIRSADATKIGALPEIPPKITLSPRPMAFCPSNTFTACLLAIYFFIIRWMMPFSDPIKNIFFIEG